MSSCLRVKFTRGTHEDGSVLEENFHFLMKNKVWMRDMEFCRLNTFIQTIHTSFSDNHMCTSKKGPEDWESRTLSFSSKLIISVSFSKYISQQNFGWLYIALSSWIEWCSYLVVNEKVIYFHLWELMENFQSQFEFQHTFLFLFGFVVDVFLSLMGREKLIEDFCQPAGNFVFFFLFWAHQLQGVRPRSSTL